MEFVTNKSQEGSQFVKGFGGIGGLLRYRLDFGAYDEHVHVGGAGGGGGDGEEEGGKGRGGDDSEDDFDDFNEDDYDFGL